MEGKYATLLLPYCGYRTIRLLSKEGFCWIAEICDSGKIIEVYEDDFILDT